MTREAMYKHYEGAIAAIRAAEKTAAEAGGLRRRFLDEIDQDIYAACSQSDGHFDRLEGLREAGIRAI